MLERCKVSSDKYILAIHSTNNYFGFAYRLINESNQSEKFLIKKFDRDLANNLIFDLGEFLSGRSFQSIERISVSNGPANFNATRLITVLARTISQQIKCPLDYYSCYRIMAKRIALKNNISNENQSFWIVNKLRNRGYIAGKYMLDINLDKTCINKIKEIIKPKLYQNIKNTYFEVDYDIKDDLKELLHLSQENHKNSISNTWEEVLPIYPISPTN